MNKNLFAKRVGEAAAKMFPTNTDAKRIAQLEAENRELKGRLVVCELQLFNTLTVIQDMLEQKDAEIAKLYAEAVEVRSSSPFQYGLQMPWAKN